MEVLTNIQLIEVLELDRNKHGDQEKFIERRRQIPQK